MRTGGGTERIFSVNVRRKGRISHRRLECWRTHRLPACRATGCLWAQTARDPQEEDLLLQELQAREVPPQGHAHR